MKPIGKIFRTVIVILVVSFVAASTVSAQDKKKVEKRIMVVSVDDNGVMKDTTIIKTDTLEFNGEKIVINTRGGRHVMRGTGEDDRMIWIERDDDSDDDTAGPVMMQHMQSMPDMMQGMRPMRMAGQNMEAGEGVSYHLIIDGVMVTIRAPKDKAGQADQILEAAKKVLMKK